MHWLHNRKSGVWLVARLLHRLENILQYLNIGLESLWLLLHGLILDLILGVGVNMDR